MKRAEKAERIQKILDELYPELIVPLRHRDPYTLLVAVLLSAQCTDVRVNEITPSLFAATCTTAAPSMDSTAPPVRASSSAARSSVAVHVALVTNGMRRSAGNRLSGNSLKRPGATSNPSDSMSHWPSTPRSA